MDPTRSVLLAGATGLVGSQLLAGLLADPSVIAVHTLGRRALDVSDPKLTHHIVDFKALPTLPRVDELYLAMGTTIKVAGSEAAFRAVDYEANLAVAKGALAAGVRRMGVVSAMGANARASLFYSRVKGELENALRQLKLDALVIARPSMLAGDREAVGQSVRSGEILAQRITRRLRPLIPANYRSIAASAVAHALLREVPRAHGVRVLLSGEMQPR